MATALCSSWPRADGEVSHRKGRGQEGAGPAHLGFLLRHHVQLLLAHPGFGFGRVKVVLLGVVRLLQAGVAKLRLLPQLAPQLLQVPQALLDGLVLGEAVAALQDVVDARLVALDLLLQRLKDTSWFLLTAGGA